MITKTVRINDEDVPVLAYMHSTGIVVSAVDIPDDAMLSDSRDLVAWDDVVDHIDWLEHGIAEWRDVAAAVQDNNAGEQDLRDKLAESVMLEGVRDFTNRFSYTKLSSHEISVIASTAYNMADAMMICRNQKPVGVRG